MIMENNDIKHYIEEYLKDRVEHKSYASFDFCYGYFHQFRDKKSTYIDSFMSNKKNIETSCFQLGFYLASSGMYRSSAFLLDYSIKIFEKVVIGLLKYGIQNKLWDIDLDNYNDDSISKLEECKEEIIHLFKKHEIRRTTDTLITRMMLGIFSNTPSFDTHFIKGMRGTRIGNHFYRENIERVKIFYDDNKKEFKKFNQKIKILNSKEENSICYNNAKLLDMYGFAKGLDENKN